MEQLSDHNTQEFEALVAHLSQSPDEGITVISYAYSAFISEIIAQLQNNESLKHIAQVQLDWQNKAVTSIEMEVEGLIAEEEDLTSQQIWHIIGLPNSLLIEILEGKDELLFNWNEEADAWKKVPVPVCLWLDTHSTTLFQEKMPKIWAMVDRQFTFLDISQPEQSGPNFPVRDSEDPETAKQIEQWKSTGDVSALAKAYMDLHKWEEAISYADEGIKKAEASNQFLEMAEAHRLKGRIFDQQSRWLNAVSEFQKALSLEQAVDYHGAETRFRIANVLATAGLTDMAKSWYEEISEIKESGALEYAAKSHRNLGVIYINQNEVDLAFSHYGHALDGLEEAGAWESLAYTHEQVADIFVHLHQIEDAIEHHKAAATHFRETANHRQEALNYKRIARLQEFRGHIATALTYYQQAQEGFLAANAREELLENLQKMGAIHQDQMKWAKALEFYEAALPIAKELKFDFAIDALEDSIEEMQEKVQEAPSGKKGLFGGLFGK